MGWGGSRRLFEFDWEGGGLGVGAYSRLSAYYFLSVFRIDAYLSRALIRGWALIRINTVRVFLVFRPSPRKAIASLHKLLLYGTNPT